MQRVLVLTTDRRPLMPCSSARARILLKQGKAAVFRRFPFTVILKHRTEGATQPIELKGDPGSKTTGIALADPPLLFGTTCSTWTGTPVLPQYTQVRLYFSTA